MLRNVLVCQSLAGKIGTNITSLWLRRCISCLTFTETITIFMKAAEKSEYLGCNNFKSLQNIWGTEHWTHKTCSSTWFGIRSEGRGPPGYRGDMNGCRKRGRRGRGDRQRENNIFIIDKSDIAQTEDVLRTHRWTQCSWKMEVDTGKKLNTSAEGRKKTFQRERVLCFSQFLLLRSLKVWICERYNVCVQTALKQLPCLLSPWCKLIRPVVYLALLETLLAKKHHPNLWGSPHSLSHTHKTETRNHKNRELGSYSWWVRVSFSSTIICSHSSGQILKQILADKVFKAEYNGYVLIALVA